MITTTLEIEKRLKELLVLNQSFGIALNGKWGVGKTVFWNNFVKKNFFGKTENKKVAYISLFGQETIQQIKNDLLLQIYTQNGFIKKIKDKVGSFKLYGMDISLALSWFEKKDFENVIVCFDDFERISDRLKLKDVLGLISELKEQKKCTVVMILNKEELQEDDLSKYKDKIVDFDFNYEPSAEESFSLVKDDLKAFNKYPLEYFQKYNINNIRIMKRVINALNDYAHIEEIINKHDDIARELVENILEIATINAMDLSIDFEKLCKYSNPYDLDELANQDYGQPKKEKQKNEQYDKLLKYINFGSYGYFSMSDITHNVVNYVKTSIADKEVLQKSIDERIERKAYSQIEEQISEYVNKARYDLNYPYEQYVKELFEILKANKDKITSVLNLDYFLFCIYQLKEFDTVNSEKYESFAIDILKKYLELYLENYSERYSGFDKERIEKIINFSSKLKEYYDHYEIQEEIEKINSTEKIVSLMLSPIRNQSWGDEPTFLTKVKEEDLENYFYQNMNFVDDSLSFLSNSISKYKDFIIFRNKLINVMKKISQTGTTDQQIKMKKILKYLQEE